MSGLRFVICSSLGLLLGFSGLLLAQEDLHQAYGDEEFVSIATGTTQSLAKAPSVASVITARDIEIMGATTLDEVLEGVPGLHVSLSSTRFSPIYSIRGIHTDKNPQVLVLVNGVPMTQVLLGDRGTRSSLPVASIARVEVIRGPGSAVYGADAFSGVINVITKTSSDINGTSSGVRAGTSNTRNLWILHGGQWGGVDVAFSFEYLHTNGDRDRVITADAQALLDGLLGTNASLAPGSAETGQKRFDTRLDLKSNGWHARFWNWRQDNIGTGPGVSLALDPSGFGDVDNYLLEFGLDELISTEQWSVDARLTYMDINTKSEQELFPPGTVLPIGVDGNISLGAPVGFVAFPNGYIGNPEVYEQHTRLDVTSHFTGFNDHRVRMAAGVHYAELKPEEAKNFGPGVIDGTEGSVGGVLTDVAGTPFIFIRDEDRTSYYASVQDEWNIASDWTLTSGIRVDHYSDFGTTMNPRLALVWQTRHDVTSKLLYGRAFRAPSFAELFFINNPIALGNPDLDPEVINTVELAFDYHPPARYGGIVSLFGYDLEDQIEFVGDAGGTTFVAENQSGRQGYGVELEAHWSPVSSVQLNANYAYQHSEDDDGGDSGGSPEHQVFLDARWKLTPVWTVATQLNWVAERKRVDGDPRKDIDDYTNVNLTLRGINIIPSLGVSLSAKNVFDHRQKEPSPANASIPTGSLVPNDFPLSGRHLFAELRYHF